MNNRDPGKNPNSPAINRQLERIKADSKPGVQTKDPIYDPKMNGNFFKRAAAVEPSLESNTASQDIAESPSMRPKDDSKALLRKVTTRDIVDISPDTLRNNYEPDLLSSSGEQSTDPSVDREDGFPSP